MKKQLAVSLAVLPVHPDHYYQVSLRISLFAGGVNSILIRNGRLILDLLNVDDRIAYGISGIGALCLDRFFVHRQQTALQRHPMFQYNQEGTSFQLASSRRGTSLLVSGAILAAPAFMVLGREFSWAFDDGYFSKLDVINNPAAGRSDYVMMGVTIFSAYLLNMAYHALHTGLRNAPFKNSDFTQNGQCQIIRLFPDRVLKTGFSFLLPTIAPVVTSRLFYPLFRGALESTPLGYFLGIAPAVLMSGLTIKFACDTARGLSPLTREDSDRFYDRVKDTVILPQDMEDNPLLKWMIGMGLLINVLMGTLTHFMMDRDIDRSYYMLLVVWWVCAIVYDMLQNRFLPKIPSNRDFLDNDPYSLSAL